MTFPTPPRAGMGVESSAPSFSLTPGDIALLQMRNIEDVQRDLLDKELAATRLDTIRRQCARANRAEHRLWLALWWGGGYAAFATVAAGYAFYLYLWGAR